MTTGTHGLGLTEAPLGVPKLVGDRLRGHVLQDGGPGSRLPHSGMNGHELEIVVDLDGVVPGLEPQASMNQGVGRRVIGLLELDMAVPMEFHLAPGGDLHGDIRQGLEQGLLRIGKKGEGFFPRRSVDAVPRRLHHPPAELLVGVGQGAERSQGNKAVLDVLDP